MKPAVPPFKLNERRLSDSDVNTINSTAEFWFEHGSRLYHAAEVLSRVEHSETQCWKLVVGKPLDNEMHDPMTEHLELQMVIGMLFGMDVENWLKGLWLSKEQQRVFEEVQASSVDPFDVACFQATDDRLAAEVMKGRHDLNVLATRAGVAPKLDSTDRDFLKLLTSAIKQGRYPADQSKARTEAGVFVINDQRRWSRIMDAIHSTLKAVTV